jgi:hypothetical protein
MAVQQKPAREDARPQHLAFDVQKVARARMEIEPCLRPLQRRARRDPFDRTVDHDGDTRPLATTGPE